MRTAKAKLKSFDEFDYAAIVVMSPHPDDSALACGGLLNKLRENRPKDVRISIFGATTGFRGVDDADLKLARKQAREGLAEWQQLDPRSCANEQSLLKAVKKKLGKGFASYGEKDDLAFRNMLKAALRFREIRAEGRALHLNPDRDVRFLAYSNLYNRRITLGELRDLHRNLVDAAVPGKKNLLLVPHPDDPQPAHQVVTEASIRALGTEVDWDVWYYQSPWFTINPALVDVIISLNEADIGEKKNAVSKHGTQTKRTPYVDYAQAQARLLADVLPELVLGFGCKGVNAFGNYCEIYQKRLPRFYSDGETTGVAVYSDDPLDFST